MQVFASSRGVSRELIHECTRIAYIAPPPIRGGDFNQVMPASFGVFRGETVDYILARAQRLGDGTPVAHYMPIPSIILRWLGGSYTKLEAFINQPISGVKPGEQAPFIFEPIQPNADEQNEALLNLMRFTKSNTKMIGGLLGGLVQAMGVGVINAPASIKDRLAFAEGILALLPVPARVAITLCTSVVDSQQIRAQFKFFDAATFPQSFIVYDWATRRLVGAEPPEDVYSKFVMSQLRLDTSVVVEQTEKASRTAVWRAMRKDDLANALAWIARRSTLDSMISTNQPAPLNEIAGVLREDPTLPDDLRVAYAKHLVTRSLVDGDLEHTNIIPTISAHNKDVSDAIFVVLEAAAAKMETAQAVFDMVEEWVLHPPLGVDVERWRPLLSLAVQTRHAAVMATNDTAGLLALTERLVETPVTLGIERIIVQLITSSYRKAYEDARIARAIFLMAISHLPMGGLQRILSDQRYVAQLPPLIQEAIAYLVHTATRVPKQGILSRAAESYGSEVQPLILGRLVEWAFNTERYDLIDTETLRGMVKVAASSYGERFDPLFVGMAQHLATPDLLRRMPTEMLHRLITMSLARGRFDYAVQQMQSYQDGLFKATEQWQLAEIGRVAIREAPLTSADALAALNAVRESGLRPMLQIGMVLGALEGQKWSPEMEPAARTLGAFWIPERKGDPRLIAVFGVESALRLLHVTAARRDRIEALQLVDAIVKYALTLGGDTESLSVAELFDQVYTIAGWSPDMVRAILNAFCVYVRGASSESARQVAIHMGERHGAGARDVLEAAYTVREVVSGHDLVTFSEYVSASAELLIDLAAVYYEGQETPPLFKLRRTVQGTIGGLNDGEKRRIGENFWLIAQYIMQLQNMQQARNNRRSRSDNEQLRAKLMTGSAAPTTSLEALTWIGAYFSQGRVAEVSLGREAPPHIFGSRSLNMVLSETDHMVELLRGLVKAFPADTGKDNRNAVPTFSSAAWSAEIENAWAQLDLVSQRQIQDSLGSDAQRFSRILTLVGAKGNDRVLQDGGPGRQLYIGRQQPRTVIEVLRWLHGYFLGVHEV
jgi:hypothetical protein